YTADSDRTGAVVARFDGPGTPEAAFHVLQGSPAVHFRAVRRDRGGRSRPGGGVDPRWCDRSVPGEVVGSRGGGLFLRRAGRAPYHRDCPTTLGKWWKNPSSSESISARRTRALRTCATRSRRWCRATRAR